jgi:hypothetical protein
MTYKKVRCAEHGGQFSIPVKRGRPPTKCSEDNPCDMVKPPRRGSKEVAARTAQTRRGKMPVSSTEANRQTLIKKPAQVKTEAPSVVKHNPSIVVAREARDLLEPQGWNLKGRAWEDDVNAQYAEITATRGEEILRIVFKDGKFLSQDYSLWDSDKTPGQNGKPKSRLPFDPNEMTDSELARELSGRTVWWWNKLAKAQETAVIGDNLKIEHAYTGGNETSRQVHFVDKTPSHAAFRAFNVDALMRVK